MDFRRFPKKKKKRSAPGVGPHTAARALPFAPRAQRGVKSAAMATNVDSQFLNPYCTGRPHCAVNDRLNVLMFGGSASRRLVDAVGSAALAHYFLAYARVAVGAAVLYYIFSGGSYLLFSRGKVRPEVMWAQIKMSQSAIVFDAAMPVFAGLLIDSGWTRAYYSMAEGGGWLLSLISSVLYFAVVEIGVYWMHRGMHENKFLYRHLHSAHHNCSYGRDVTPWASLAFYPLDGLINSSPYIFALFFMPCHHLTILVLLTFVLLWTVAIHDTHGWLGGPFLAAQNHLVHHLYPSKNYGQIFVYCDQMFGTFQSGKDLAAKAVDTKAA